MDRRLVFRPYPRSVEVTGDPERQPQRAHWTWRVPGLFKGAGRSGDYGQSDWGGPGLARKACGGGRVVSVPQTDTGGWVQVHQGGRENLRQGTRQSHPVTSGEGVPVPVYHLAWEADCGPQRAGPGDCLTKTQVSANP